MRVALARGASCAIKTALVAHVVITAFENLPHGRLSLGMRLPVFKKIPQWRFFAPNPGIEDLYLLYRHSLDGSDPWGQWLEVPIYEAPGRLSFVWNPGSRSAKALFDAAHQLRVLAGYGSSLEWVTTSVGFELVADVVRTRCYRDGTTGRFQFMILAATPGQGRDGLRPIMVSPAQYVDTNDTPSNSSITPHPMEEPA